MVYVKFLQENSGVVMEALGTEGVFILDGRNKLSTMIDDAYERMHKLRNVHPNYVGFQIYKDPACRWGGRLLYTSPFRGRK